MLHSQVQRIAAIIGATVSLCGALAYGQDSQVEPPPADKIVTTTAPQKWEYAQEWACRDRIKIGAYPDYLRSRLQRYGEKGWKLVSFTPISVPNHNDCFLGTFKRPATK